MLPRERCEEIRTHLAALNLDGTTFNPVLAAFGVKISGNPIKVVFQSVGNLPDFLLFLIIAFISLHLHQGGIG